MIKVDESSLVGKKSFGCGQNVHHTATAKAITKTETDSYEAVSAKPSFTGAKWTPIQEMFLKLMPKGEAKWFKKMNAASEYISGEAGGIAVTAVGTGLVAPFPIAFNPFVKAKPGASEEEKEEIRKTKAYSAWRQPISALLAIAFQLSAQKPIDKFLQNLTNDADTANKYFKDWVLNQASLNDEKYLTRRITQELQHGNFRKIEDIMITDKDGTVRPAANLEEAVKQLKQNMVNEQIDNIAKSLKENGSIKMGTHLIKDSAVAEVVNDRIDQYIETATDLKKSEDSIAYHKNKAVMLVENKDYLNDVLAKEKIDAIPRMLDENGKVVQSVDKHGHITTYADPKKLKEYIESLKASAPNDNARKILQEIIEKSDDVRESRCARTLERIKTVERACNNSFNADVYEEYMKKQNLLFDEKIRQLQELKIKDITKANPAEIQKTIEEIAMVCQFDPNDVDAKRVFRRSGIFMPGGDEKEIEKATNKVYKDVVKTYKEFTANKFKFFKQMTKIGVGVCVTLPITCTALNWVYPRFMAKFFPNLANSKKEADAKKMGGVK